MKFYKVFSFVTLMVLSSTTFALSSKDVYAKRVLMPNGMPCIVIYRSINGGHGGVDCDWKERRERRRKKREEDTK